MYCAIRDGMLLHDEFASPVEGARHLGVEALEITLNDDFSVAEMDSKKPVVLQTDEDAAAYKNRVVEEANPSGDHGVFIADVLAGARRREDLSALSLASTGWSYGG